MLGPVLLWLSLSQPLFETASLLNHDSLHLVLLCTANNKKANSV